MFPGVSHGSTCLQLKPMGIFDGGGTLMDLARLGGVLRVFSGVERMEGTKESTSWGGGLSSSSCGLSVRPGHCPGVGLTCDIC